MTEHAYILTLSCPDRLGLVHTVSGFLLEQSANIEEAAQYNDQATGLFFMRVQFACAAHDLASLKAAFAALAEPLQMRWRPPTSSSRGRRSPFRRAASTAWRQAKPASPLRAPMACPGPALWR